MIPIDVCVLIADDEPMIAAIMERVVAAMGLTSVTVSDGAQAIQTASLLQGQLICAILDVVMPGTDGVAAAEAIRQMFPALPIVLMSGYIPSELLQRFYTIPQVMFLQKPFNLSAAQALLAPILLPTGHMV
jgi:CheY-like chemotaxis protein